MLQPVTEVCGYLIVDAFFFVDFFYIDLYCDLHLKPVIHSPAHLFVGICIKGLFACKQMFIRVKAAV